MRDGTTASFDKTKQESGSVPVNFVKLDFASGAVFVNSSPYSLVFNGDTYLGVGNLGAISTVQEGADLQSRGIELTLSGIPPALISIALDEDYQGRLCSMWLGFLDSSHDHTSLVADPINLGVYLMDTMDIALGKTATITVRAESRLVRWDKAKSARYTNEEQQRRFPGDLGLEFIPQMAEKELVWGRTR